MMSRPSPGTRRVELAAVSGHAWAIKGTRYRPPQTGRLAAREQEEQLYEQQSTCEAGCEGVAVQAALQERVSAARGLHERLQCAEVEAELREVNQHLPAHPLCPQWFVHEPNAVPVLTTHVHAG